MHNLELNNKEVKGIGQNRWLKENYKTPTMLLVTWIGVAGLAMLIDNDIFTYLWALAGFIFAVNFALNMNHHGNKFLKEIENKKEQ